MAVRTSPINLVSSSSAWLSTPALHKAGPSSSSPASEVLATPTDELHPHRGGNRKGTRSGRALANDDNSSPQLQSKRLHASLNLDGPSPIGESHDLTDDDSHQLRAASADPASRNHTARPRSRASVPPRPASVGPNGNDIKASAEGINKADDLISAAQAAGISPDQFEQAKVEMRQFLRGDDKGKGKATFGRSDSHANTSSPQIHATPAHHGRPSSSAAPTPTFARPEQRDRGRDLREWAAQAGSDSSSDDDEPAKEQQKTGLLPAQTPSGSLERGMMERLLSVRPSRDNDEGPIQPLSYGQHPNVRARGLSPTTSPAVQRGGLTNAGLFSPTGMLPSPVPARGNAASLMSPDVARLLRSELDELNNNPHRKFASQSKLATLQDNFSSPYVHTSPFGSSAQANRNHDVFSTDDSAVKRDQWEDTETTRERPGSPTPSAASLRAPSFCDSSPAMSEASAAKANALRVAVPPSQGSSAQFGQYDNSISPGSSQGSLSDYQSGPKSAGTQSTDAGASVVRGKRTPARQSVEPTYATPATRPTFKPIGPPSTSKPNFSYAALIGQAIFSTPQAKISLNDIYSFIMEHYPFYKKTESGWQNSIRHNLSLNECFEKTQRGPDNPGKGCLWAVKAGCEDQFADGGFTKRGAANSGRKVPPKSLVKSGSMPPPSDVFTETPARPTRPVAPSRRGSVVPTREQSPYSPEPSPGPSLMSSHRASPQPQPQLVYQQEEAARRQWEMQQAYEHERRMQDQARHHQIMLEQQQQHAYAAQQEQLRLAHEQQIMIEHERERELERERALRRAPTPPPVLAPIQNPTPQRAGPSGEAVEHTPRQAPREVHELDTHSNKKPKLDAAFVPSHIRKVSGQLPSLFSGGFDLATASPPTNVYKRLARPYEPLSSVDQTPGMQHRAAALLGSPVAVGIMGNRPGERFDRMLMPNGHSDRRMSTSSDDLAAPFMPSPNIFGSALKRRARTESNGDKEEERSILDSLLNQGSHVHTQSPVSSMRGGPAAEEAPSSPGLGASFEAEKKRSRSHLPSVQALTDAAENDSFGTPARRRMRSPSGRGYGAARALENVMMTPGGRPGGRSVLQTPGQGPDYGWDVFSTNGQVQEELENLRRAGMPVPAATPGMAKAYWPSPAPPAKYHDWA